MIAIGIFIPDNVIDGAPNGSPSALALTVDSDTAITLNWTIGSTNHDGHRIYISTDGVNFTEKGTVTGSTATYQATGLTQGTQYYFYVVAYNGPGESVASNTANATTYNYFKITIDTTKAGSANDTFVLPLPGSGTYDYYIDWGDGAGENHITANTSQTKDYGTSGTYQIKIRGTFPRIYFNNGGDKLKLISIDNWGSIVWSSMEYAFYGCLNMNGTYTDAPNLSSVTNVHAMFASCVIFDHNIDFDTSNVENFDSFLYNCYIFNHPVNLNTANATTCRAMFESCLEFNQSVASFVTSKVATMANMFNECHKFNQSVSNFDTSKVTNMQYMFGANWFFNQSVSNFDTSKVTNMQYMFSRCYVFKQSLATFNMALVDNVTNMFSGAEGNCDINEAGTTTNYDATLVSWAAQDLINSKSIIFGISKYSDAGGGKAARAAIIADDLWTITDGGELV